MSYELITNDFILLTVTVASVAFFHVLLGPDHYLPFSLMAKARGWSLKKLLFITFFCGAGHVLSSVIIGGIGILLGKMLIQVEAVESFRGEIAAWALTSFGLAYCMWGINHALKRVPHNHNHHHLDGTMHHHHHNHFGKHFHIHENPEKKKDRTFLTLFLIFLLGPCEPLIPLMMYPTVMESVSGILLVVAVFTFVTIFTMGIAVIFIYKGLSFITFQSLARFSHAFAGATICVCGLGIQFWG